MKTLILIQIAFFAMLTSCQSGENIHHLLSKDKTRKEIMDAIANDAKMHKEMMDVMMKGKNGMEMMMENHEAMRKMMKENTGMMKGMMDDMMGVAKTDTAMKASMCKTMMSDPEMMKMMEKMKGGKMNMTKMKGMDKNKPVKHDAHH